jgi:TRAP-type C4-dicarboxylate transport system permease small subunit
MAGGRGDETAAASPRRAATWLDRMFEALGWLAGLILAVMAFSVFLSVVMRFAGSQALEGLDEIPRYLFVWLVAIGSAVAMHRGEHTVLDYFVNKLGVRGRAFMAVIVNAAMIFVFVWLLKLSLTLVPNSGLQSSPGLGLRLDLVYAAIPAGALLILVPLVHKTLLALAELLWPKRS